MGVDERLRDELSREPPADPSGAYERIVEKKVRRRLLRKAQAAALALAVLAGSGAGFLALVRAFEPQQRTPASGPISNGRIIFAGGEYPDYEIYSVKPDGSGLRNLSNSADTEDIYPNVSPDGLRVAFCRITETAGGFVGGIWVMDVDGGNQVQLTDGGNGECYPTWSPDGRRIAFQSDRDGQQGMSIYAMDADGSNIVRLTTGDHRDWYPAWSPSGDVIAFHRETAVGDADIFVVSAGGGDLRRITDAPGVDMMPNWSPDGGRIVFMTDRFVSDPESYPPVVAVMDADGTAVRQLTTGGEGYSEREPFWSPDGTRIGFVRGEAILSIRPDGSDEAVIVPASRRVIYCCPHPSWQPIFTDVPASPEPTATETATTEPEPGVGEDIGLAYRVCDLSSVRGRFGDPDTVGRAYVGTKVVDERCPDGPKAVSVVAIDFTDDDDADIAYEGLECDRFCSAFAAPDVDGDGTDELLVQNVQFSIAGLTLFEVGVATEVGADGPYLHPVTVAPPGDPGTFEPGEQPQLWFGGDAFNADSLACLGDGADRVLVSSTADQDPPESGPWRVHETTFRLVEGALEVVDVREFELQELSFPHDGDGICGARIPSGFADI